MEKKRLFLSVGLWWVLSQTVTVALPPPEDIPEEVLRSEIVVRGRSPLNGEALSAAKYTQLVQSFRETAAPGSLNPRIESLIFSLKLLRFLRTIIFF